MKLALLAGREVNGALRRLGLLERHRKSSHVKMEHADGRRIVFPFHDEVDRHMLRGALRDADISEQEFLEHLK